MDLKGLIGFKVLRGLKEYKGVLWGLGGLKESKIGGGERCGGGEGGEEGKGPFDTNFAKVQEKEKKKEKKEKSQMNKRSGFATSA